MCLESPFRFELRLCFSVMTMTEYEWIWSFSGGNTVFMADTQLFCSGYVFFALSTKKPPFPSHHMVHIFQVSGRISISSRKSCIFSRKSCVSTMKSCVYARETAHPLWHNSNQNWGCGTPLYTNSDYKFHVFDYFCVWLMDRAYLLGKYANTDVLCLCFAANFRVCFNRLIGKRLAYFVEAVSRKDATKSLKLSFGGP